MRIELPSIVTPNYLKIFAKIIFNHVEELNYTLESHVFVGKKVGLCSSAKILYNGEEITKTIMSGNRELAPNHYKKSPVMWRILVADWPPLLAFTGG